MHEEPQNWSSGNNCQPWQKVYKLKENENTKKYIYHENILEY
jgi:hypothetical protein